MSTDRTAEWLQNARIHQETAQIALEMKAAGNWCLAAVVNVDMPRAVAALDAVLKLADDLAAERPGEDGPGYNATRACGRRFREAITSALAGTGAQLDRDEKHG